MIGRRAAVETITLFVEDLAAARDFYTQALGLRTIHEDEVSVLVELDSLTINLLQMSAAPELVAPLHPGPPGSGPRFMITIATADCAAMVAELTARGVEFLNGPVDRPWGRRTAAFADPAGVAWEIAQELPT